MSSTSEEERSVHRDSVADTGTCYTSFRGWVLSCSWCGFQARGRTKRDAFAIMQEHYAPFDIDVHWWQS